MHKNVLLKGTWEIVPGITKVRHKKRSVEPAHLLAEGQDLQGVATAPATDSIPEPPLEASTSQQRSDIQSSSHTHSQETEVQAADFFNMQFYLLTIIVHWIVIIIVILNW